MAGGLPAAQEESEMLWRKAAARRWKASFSDWRWFYKSCGVAQDQRAVKDAQESAGPCLCKNNSLAAQIPCPSLTWHKGVAQHSDPLPQKHLDAPFSTSLNWLCLYKFNPLSYKTNPVAKNKIQNYPIRRVHWLQTIPLYSACDFLNWNNQQFAAKMENRLIFPYLPKGLVSFDDL